MSTRDAAPVRIGISTCLLGENVRYDGGHKHDHVLTLIDDYRRGLTPLVAPLTLVAHHARRLDVAYLRGQTFLMPHPKELMLRNHV